MCFTGKTGVQGQVGSAGETLLEKIRLKIKYLEELKKNYELEIKDYKYYIYERNAKLYIDKYEKAQKDLDGINERLNILENIIINDKYNILDKLFTYINNEYDMKKHLEFFNKILDGVINIGDIELTSKIGLYKCLYEGDNIYIEEENIITLQNINNQIKRAKNLKDKLSVKEETTKPRRKI